jgi:hypothetical protein
LVKFEICNDDSEIANISCKYIVSLQDFVNFKTFFEKTKAQKRLKEEIKDAELYEGKFVFNIDVLFALSPSRRRQAPCEGTNSPRLFTPGEREALAKSKVHQ